MIRGISHFVRRSTATTTTYARVGRPVVVPTRARAVRSASAACAVSAVRNGPLSSSASTSTTTTTTTTNANGGIRIARSRPRGSRSYSSSVHPRSSSSSFLTSYDSHVSDRSSLADGAGIAPKPLDASQVSDLISELKGASSSSSTEEGDRLVELITHRVPPGVDDAAYVKAAYLSALATGEETPTLISRERSIELLGTMQGGYNVSTLVDLLSDDDDAVASLAASQLKKTLLVFDAFYDVEALHNSGENAHATSVLESWADAEWYTSRPEVPSKMTVTVFKVSGETNTDDLSPAQDAWSRPDVPLHALAMLKNSRDGINPDKDGEIGPLAQMEDLKGLGHPLAYVGDVVGTGSSRKSATNSVLWFMGDDLPYVPNMRGGGMHRQ